MGPGADFRVVGKLRHELVIHGGDHQADEVGALGHHGPGHKVGGVAHLIAQLQNPFPGLTADLGAAGKGTGYGSIGDACGFGDIFQCYIFHRIDSLAKVVIVQTFPTF